MPLLAMPHHMLQASCFILTSGNFLVSRSNPLVPHPLPRSCAPTSLPKAPKPTGRELKLQTSLELVLPAHLFLQPEQGGCLAKVQAIITMRCIMAINFTLVQSDLRWHTTLSTLSTENIHTRHLRFNRLGYNQTMISMCCIPQVI